MARLQMTDLSNELKALIFSHVMRPSDLVNLCLTCHSFHEIVVKQLYHTITLDLGAESDKRIPALVSPRNKGLQHIRNVELYRADVSHNCNQLQQANLACRMLLEFLPENSLHKFSWHPWCPFSADNYKILFRTQKKLQWLEAIGVDQPLDEKFLTSLKLDGALDQCTKLGLYPDSRETLSMSHELLSRMKKVEKITIHTNFDETESTIPASELNDSAARPGLITTTVFKHMLPFDKCTPLALNELTLHKVYLRFAGESYCKFVDFSKIKTLRIFGCVGADTLFSVLSSKTSRLPDQLETLEVKHEDDRDGEALSSLDHFLTLISGIRNLTVEIACGKGLLPVASITRHAKTLKLLNVHAYEGEPGDSDEDEFIFDTEAVQKISRECSQLEQLSLAAPASSIVRSPSDDFNSFTNAVSALPSLVTLNITTWPSNNITSGSRLPRKQYEHLLQAIAQHHLEAAVDAAKSTIPPRSSKLNVIAFGTCDRIYEREDGKSTVIFVKGRQYDPLGGEKPLAVSMGFNLRKFVEPRSDVLDFALMRTLRPPTREPPPSDDNDRIW